MGELWVLIATGELGLNLLPPHVHKRGFLQTRHERELPSSRLAAARVLHVWKGADTVGVSLSTSGVPAGIDSYK